MHGITHVLTGWLVSNARDLERKDRALITLSGVAPDVDGAGIVVELATRNSSTPLLWWSEYHHVLGHNLLFAVCVSVAVLSVARRRLLTAALSFGVVHLHYLCDLVGSRGPDGYDWPIPYLVPFSGDLQIKWAGQWALNAWPNIAFTLGLLAAAFYLAWRRGFSVLGLVSKRADTAFVQALRSRFGNPQE